jgi:hypothetical protein
MNNLNYSTRDPQKVGPQVEEIIRKEIGAAAPVPYTVTEGSPTPYTVGSIVKQALVGGQLDLVFRLNFELPQPRPSRLEVSMDKQGVGCFAGTLLYSTKLSKSVGSEVALEPPKTFGKSKFTGDPQACAKLNANSGLVKLANNFARTESKGMAGGGTLKRERLFKIVPDANGAVLLIASLPRATSMGFSATVDSKDFFEIATMVEATL